MYTVQPNDETDLKPVHPKYNILNERISVIKLLFLKPYPNVSWQSNMIKYYVATKQNGKSKKKICLVTKQCKITFFGQGFRV